jgi:hypothetical protein
MKDVQNISLRLEPADLDCEKDPATTMQNAPPTFPAPVGSLAKRPAGTSSRPFRVLLADHIDRQFPLVQS